VAPVTLLAAVAAALTASAPPVRVTVDPGRVIGHSRLALGVTHTHFSLDPWGDPAAIRRGRRALRFARYQNQHLYGWGTRNPEPAPGRFDWDSLDRRVRMMRRVGAEPVITLCCAPDWMTKLGRASSSYPNLPPTPEHYDDFADLARRAAERYPDVRHFLVWNEMKGLYDHDLGNWDYVAYTDLYNRVYDALKAVSPRIAVGGPYLVIEGTGSGGESHETADPITERDRATLEYWLSHKHGADFLAVDRKTQSNHDGRTYSRRRMLGLTRWFGDITRQLRALTPLPVWFAEDSFVDDRNPRVQAAGLAAMLAAEIRGGASVSLRWGPQAVAGEPVEQNLFTDTRVRGGGRPLPPLAIYRGVGRWFGRGTPLVRARTSSGSVLATATRQVVLVVNRTNRPRTVVVGGRSAYLAGFGARFLSTR
jgi:hypothetical protein